MIKPQPSTARQRSRQPFPLYRLPSLLKRSLSLSEPSSGALPPPDLLSPSAPPPPVKTRSTSLPLPSTGDILLELLPSVRSNAFVWTYSRLLCTSASYIAGMAFYDLLASILSLGHSA